MTRYVLIALFTLLFGITLAYPMMAVDGGTIPEPTPPGTIPPTATPTLPGTIPPATPTETPLTPEPTATTPVTPQPTPTEPTALPTMPPPGIHHLYLPWVPVSLVLDDGWP